VRLVERHGFAQHRLLSVRQPHDADTSEGPIRKRSKQEQERDANLIQNSDGLLERSNLGFVCRPKHKQQHNHQFP
jgi:hypothetical protein